MARLNLTDLQEGAVVRGVFQLQETSLVRYRQKEGHFLRLVLGDKTGRVEARLWDASPKQAEEFSRGKFVRVQGRAANYRKNIELHLDSCELVPESEVNLADFRQTTPLDRGEMLGYLREVIVRMHNPHLRSLLEVFLADEDWLRAFAEAPAAKLNHQAYLGGLLEHTYNMLRLVPALAAVYPEMDAELLAAGIILHDTGKVREYSWERLIDFTTGGRLLGHIVLGVEMAGRAMDGLADFPAGLRLKLLHMIASHHGRYEWQSPKRPKFLEACLLHQIDLLDTEADKFRRAARGTGSNWAWSGNLERYVYLGEEAAGEE